MQHLDHRPLALAVLTCAALLTTRCARNCERSRRRHLGHLLGLLNQADAQRAADTRDADGDGIYSVIYSG